MRGATARPGRSWRWAGYFNPRSPCGERLGRLLSRSVVNQFQSTLPMRGATFRVGQIIVDSLISIHAPHAGSDATGIRDVDGILISIHAPHAGSDAGTDRGGMCSTDFNPRSPCGERRNINDSETQEYDFNPRSPCGERLGGLRGFPDHGISIHAPHAGSDSIDFPFTRLL